MVFTDAAPQSQTKPAYRALAGRPKKIFRDPLAPYVRCRCNRCPRCLDNAKWDKVFEKLVDPTYYHRPPGTPMRSPLTEL